MTASAKKRDKIPQTAALRVLRAAKISFDVHLYTYVPRGGTRASSSALGVAEHMVIKTLVFDDGNGGSPLLVLMHGDCEVSAKALARHLGVKQLQPCTPQRAEKLTGYQVGGTSPFGTRRSLPIYVEQSILDLQRLWINGGRRGLLVSLSANDLQSVLNPFPIQVARQRG